MSRPRLLTSRKCSLVCCRVLPLRHLEEIGNLCTTVQRPCIAHEPSNNYRYQIYTRWIQHQILSISPSKHLPNLSSFFPRHNRNSSPDTHQLWHEFSVHPASGLVAVLPTDANLIKLYAIVIATQHSKNLLMNTYLTDKLQIKTQSPQLI